MLVGMVSLTNCLACGMAGLYSSQEQLVRTYVFLTFVTLEIVRYVHGAPKKASDRGQHEVEMYTEIDETH